MEWPIIIAIVVGVMVIIFPAALIWFINVSGILTVIRETRKRKAALKKKALAAKTEKH